MMTELKFACPQCKQPIQCDAAYAGAQINCPSCGQAVIAPVMASGGVPDGVIQIKISTLRRAAAIGLGLLLTLAVLELVHLVFAGPKKVTFKAYLDGTDVVNLRGDRLWIGRK